MAQLTDEERIARVEMAPKEVQTMVAKAFIRDDIDDETIQYTFNNANPEELIDEGCEIENLNNEELPEGIGAITPFTIRTTIPEAGNKNYITRGSGGWSPCIKGNPTYKDCDALANCVGYANGRYNEIYNLLKGYAGCKFPMSCNAENFIEAAQRLGLEIGSTPKPGAIMVWQNGELGGKDGAGHVEVVEIVYDNNNIYTSSSGWGSSAIFWNTKRNNNNGRWGMPSSYKFRAFIYNPAVEETPTPEITPTVARDIYTNQLKTLREMNVRTDIETTSPSLGMVPAGNIYNYYEAKKGKSSVWYAITEDKSQWIAGTNYNGTEYCEIYSAQPKPEPQPEPPVTELQIGDQVEIIGTGNGSTDGSCNTAYGIHWKRTILDIWTDRQGNLMPYPYQVGNNTGTTGFYKASALRKI